MVGWIVVGVVVWLVLVALVLVLLTAAKRAEAVGQADWITAGAWPRAVASATSGLARQPAVGALTRLAQDVRLELAVDEVIVVVREQRTRDRVVVVAVAGLPAELVGVSLDARGSLAAAVALSGHAVIAPDHGSLDRSSSGEGGDAAAVSLTSPAGAIAIARPGRGQRLGADDLQRLRAVVRRHDLLGVDGPPPQPAPDNAQQASVATKKRLRSERDRADAPPVTRHDRREGERLRGRSWW